MQNFNKKIFDAGSKKNCPKTIKTDIDRQTYQRLKKKDLGPVNKHC